MSRLTKLAVLSAVVVVAAVAAGPAVAAPPRPVFIPGYTDVPNALRLQKGPLTQTQLAQIARAVAKAQAQVATTERRDGFNWGDAGIGGAVVAAVLLALTAMAVAIGRVRRPATTL